MKKQLKLLGLSIDWNLEISTCDKILQTPTRAVYRFL